MSHFLRVAPLSLALGSLLALGGCATASEPVAKYETDAPVRNTHAGNPRTNTDDPVSKAQGEMVSQIMSDDDTITNFEHADADSSGSISREEFDALKHDSMVFTDIDSDRNGVISHMEWDNHGQNTDDDK